MTSESMMRGYFDWMYNKVTEDNTINTDYKKLLNYLFRKDFNFKHPMDSNRLEDGVNLRYRYGNDCCYTQREVSNLLDVFPCSVLEMMVALSIRCEESIMCDEDIGDRTSKWFWSMIKSLGLEYMYDDAFNEKFCDLVIRKFIDREYYPDGKGGLFTIKHPKADMRNVDIWYQMCAYLNEYIQ